MLSHPLRKVIDTEATSVPPCGVIATVCRSPCVRTSRLAKNAPPVTVAWISALVARPETVPDTLRVASLQVPEIAPPSKITLLLISSL